MKEYPAFLRDLDSLTLLAVYISSFLLNYSNYLTIVRYSVTRTSAGVLIPCGSPSLSYIDPPNRRSPIKTIKFFNFYNAFYFCSFLGRGYLCKNTTATIILCSSLCVKIKYYSLCGPRVPHTMR